MGALNMMLNIMPYHCTCCIQAFKGMVHISDEARQQELNLIELQSDDAVKEPIWDTLEASDPIFVNGFGHGNIDIFTGDDEEAVFTDEECNILAGRVVYLLSCLTAVELGPAVIDAGGITYIGFDISWTWMAANITADPYNDWYAEGFYRSSNECPIALIQGDTVSVAKDRSIAEYNRWIEIWENERSGDPYAADAIGWLIYDRDGLTVLGDQSATIATGATFSQVITGLVPNTTYHFRAFAVGFGTGYGADRTFVTAPAAVLPTVTTDPATGRGAMAATVNGTLNQGGGEACECGFEWGLDTGYGITTPTESKTTSETFSQVLGGLAPNTTYHFRAFATNSKGTSYGADRTFTTALVISRAFALAREEL